MVAAESAYSAQAEVIDIVRRIYHLQQPTPTMHPIVHHPVVKRLSELFDDTDVTTRLASTLTSLSPHTEELCLRIDVVICTSDSIRSNVSTANDKSLSLV